MAERFFWFIGFQFLTHFFNQQFTELLWTIADFIYASQDTLTSWEPFIVVRHSQSVHQYIHLNNKEIFSNEEIFSNIAFVWIILADYFRNLFYCVIVSLIGIYVIFQYVNEGLEILFFDKRLIFGKSNSDDSYYGSFLIVVLLISLKIDKLIPHVSNCLMFYNHYFFS